MYFNEIKYANDSWYVDVSAFFYSEESQRGKNLDFIFRLDTKNLRVRKVNVNLSRLEGSELKNEINGWRIEIPRIFLPPSLENNSLVSYSHLSANFLVVVNASNTGWLPGPFIVVNRTQFPVYFVLKRNNQVKNVTLLFLNTTPVWMWYGYYNENTTGIPGYWFPDDVKIVNVTPCRNITNTANTSTATRGICGPGFVLLVTAVVPLLKRRFYGH